MSKSLDTAKRISLAFTKLKRDVGPQGKAPSISEVARLAGVSHTLIHTKYPEIAEQIRVAKGRGAKQRLEKQRDDLKTTLDRFAELRSDLKEVKRINGGLASENARLTLLVKRLEKEVAVLEAGVRPLRPRTSQNGAGSNE